LRRLGSAGISGEHGAVRANKNSSAATRSIEPTEPILEIPDRDLDPDNAIELARR